MISSESVDSGPRLARDQAEAEMNINYINIPPPHARSNSVHTVEDNTVRNADPRSVHVHNAQHAGNNTDTHKRPLSMPSDVYHLHRYFDFMVKDIDRSGIPIQTALDLGWFPVDQEEAEKAIGFSLPPYAGGGYGIVFEDPRTGKRMRSPDGDDVIKVRFQKPVEFGNDGKPAKYLFTKNAGMRCFILRDVHRRLVEDPNLPLGLTEGEKKVVPASLKGVPLIALPGIWGWMRGKHDKRINRDLLPYLRPGREAWLIFDSDAVEPGKAEDFDRCSRDLATALFEHGMRLRRLDLPEVGL